MVTDFYIVVQVLFESLSGISIAVVKICRTACELCVSKLHSAGTTSVLGYLKLPHPRVLVIPVFF